MTRKDIIDAYTWIRRNNSTIPDDVLDFMKNSSIKELENRNLIKSLDGILCDHPLSQREGWHDSSILCNKCSCIIEQFGIEINPPSPL